MAMVATAYRTTHHCSDIVIAHILVLSFTGQLKDSRMNIFGSGPEKEQKGKEKWVTDGLCLKMKGQSS